LRAFIEWNRCSIGEESLNIVILGCTRRKALSAGPLHAFELYQGGYFPEIRSRIKNDREYWSRIFVLSAKYGLLRGDDSVTTYDQPLTIDRAYQLRYSVAQDVERRMLAPYDPSEIVVLLDPLYIVLVADLLSAVSRPRLFWEPDPAVAWSKASAILDGWGWPR
jgi:hypothetical protein